MPKPSRSKSSRPKDKLDAVTTIKTINYLDRNGCDHIGDWLDGMSDKKARAAIVGRMTRVSAGNFGDAKPLRDGVWELRVDVGSGYRVYYAKAGRTVVLLLCGGDKRNQNRDIDRACGYWLDWKQRRKKNEG